MIPNGVFTPSPPAYGCPPGRVWHDAQWPAAARGYPWALDSAENLSGVGRSSGAITARRDKSTRPAIPRNATARIAIAMRRITESPPSGTSHNMEVGIGRPSPHDVGPVRLMGGRQAVALRIERPHDHPVRTDRYWRASCIVRSGNAARCDASTP